MLQKRNLVCGEREQGEKAEGTEIRIKRARWQEGRRLAHEKLLSTNPFAVSDLTLLRVPTHPLLLIPSRQYL